MNDRLKRSWELHHSNFCVSVSCKFDRALDADLVEELDRLASERLPGMIPVKQPGSVRYTQKEKITGALWPGVYFSLDIMPEYEHPDKFYLRANGTPDSPVLDECFDLVSYLVGDCPLDLKFNNWELEFYSEMANCDFNSSGEPELLLDLLAQEELNYDDKYRYATVDTAWRHGEIIWDKDGRAFITTPYRKPVFFDKDLRLIESLKFNDQLSPNYNPLKNCLYWDDEVPEGLTESSSDLFWRLLQGRAAVHLNQNIEDPDLIDLWERARYQIYFWTGFKRLQLSDQDKEFFEKNMKKRTIS